jgi:hypothetical protein
MDEVFQWERPAEDCPHVPRIKAGNEWEKKNHVAEVIDSRNGKEN